MSNSDPFENAFDPFAADDTIHPDVEEFDPFADDTPPANPLDSVEYDSDVPDIEADLLADFDVIEKTLSEQDLAVKKNLQKQDRSQREQFRNLYDTDYYVNEVYKTTQDRERSMMIMSRILNVDHNEATFGMWRNGHLVLKALEHLADRLDIDISDLR